MIQVHAEIQSQEYSDNDGLFLLVYVKDQGIGMSKEEMKRVFEPFFSSSNTQSKKLNFYSNGVGLSICKQIINSLDGEINVVSKP